MTKTHLISFLEKISGIIPANFKTFDNLRRLQMPNRNFIQQQRSEALRWQYRAMGRQRGKLGLTRAQSKSTASRTSSWWPILDTPKSSSSWWVIRSSLSPPTFSLSKVLMYCCRQSSSPEGWQENFLLNSATWKNWSWLAAFRICYETFIYLTCSNRGWYHFSCQNFCCRSVKPNT